MKDSLLDWIFKKANTKKTTCPLHETHIKYKNIHRLKIKDRKRYAMQKQNKHKEFNGSINIRQSRHQHQKYDQR